MKMWRAGSHKPVRWRDTTIQAFSWFFFFRVGEGWKRMGGAIAWWLLCLKKKIAGPRHVWAWKKKNLSASPAAVGAQYIKEGERGGWRWLCFTFQDIACYRCKVLFNEPLCELWKVLYCFVYEWCHASSSSCIIWLTSLWKKMSYRNQLDLVCVELWKSNRQPSVNSRRMKFFFCPSVDWLS